MNQNSVILLGYKIYPGMSLYSVNVLGDVFTVSAGSKTTVDAMGKAFQLGGKVEVKVVNLGSSTKYYIGVAHLKGAATTIQDGDFLLRDAEGDYIGLVSAADFAEDYSLVDESS